MLNPPPHPGYAKDITPQSLVTLLSDQTNLLIVLSSTATPLTSLAPEFGLVPPPPLTPLISHFPARPPPHTTIPIPLPAAHPFLTPNTPPILFSGAPHLLSTNPQIVPVVRAPPESFAADSDSDAGADAIVDSAEKGGEGLWAGGQMGVVTGFQAVGGARAMFVGGVEVFSDKFAGMEVERWGLSSCLFFMSRADCIFVLPHFVCSGVKSGNKQFVQDITKWTFQETLVLRIDNTTHHRVGEAVPRETYTTNDNVVRPLTLLSAPPRRSMHINT
jgi:dolichyl-diphosphooligosaccharide---protein glycosyltransferase subunit DDOST/WBP1